MSSYTIAPAVRSVLTQATIYIPGRDKQSDGLLGDASHAARKSDHNPDWSTPEGWVRACDLTHNPEKGLDAHLWVRWYLLSGLPGVERIQYVISKDEIWNRDRKNEGFREYTGANEHMHHCHISIRKGFEKDVRSWGFEHFTGHTPAPTPEAQPPAKPEPNPMQVLAFLLGVAKTRYYKKGNPDELVNSFIRNGLRMHGFASSVAEHGPYDDNLKWYVAEFQKKYGLTPDGIVGPQTWKVMYGG